jgi:hypothetical protein
MLNRVEIHHKGFPSADKMEISVNGNPIKARLIDYRQETGRFPVCTITLDAMPDIDTLSKIDFRFTEQTIQEASLVILAEIKHNINIRLAFEKSICSAIEDYDIDGNLASELSSHILKRIICEE